MMEINERITYYWLSHSGLSCKKLCAVLSVYSPMELWQKITEDKRLKDVLGVAHYNNLIDFRNVDLLNSRMKMLEGAGIGLLTFCDENYPESLRQKEVNPPAVLYYKGNIDALKKPCVAIVGTRIASRYGKDIAESFARALAASGAAVVSGLATGIDTYAHAAAVEHGTTIAVMGGGFNFVAQGSFGLFSRIISSGGLVVTEYSPATSPTKYSFPERNRIISGLSRGVIVIEAGDRSGALITADFALEQGREVYAVPGNINSPKSRGCNELIKSGGAMFVTEINDILSDLSLKTDEKTKQKQVISLDIFEQKIYNLLSSGQKQFDEILDLLKMKAHELSPVLFSLELRSIIKRLPANTYALDE